MMRQAPPHKASAIFMDANVLALLCYIIPLVLMWIPYISYLAWVFPLVIYLMEKQSPFIRFHALQNLVFSIVRLLIGIVLGILIAILASIAVAAGGFGAAIGIAAFSGIAGIILNILFVVFGVMAAIKSYAYVEYEIPVVGKLTRKFGKLY